MILAITAAVRDRLGVGDLGSDRAADHRVPRRADVTVQVIMVAGTGMCPHAPGAAFDVQALLVCDRGLQARGRREHSGWRARRRP